MAKFNINSNVKYQCQLKNKINLKLILIFAIDIVIEILICKFVFELNSFLTLQQVMN
ncbi:hypothetical protein D3C86_812600 [compost metagenome]